MRTRAIGIGMNWVFGYGVVICDTPVVVFRLEIRKTNNDTNRYLSDATNFLTPSSLCFHMSLLMSWCSTASARVIVQRAFAPSHCITQTSHLLDTSTCMQLAVTRPPITSQNGKPTAKVSHVTNNPPKLSLTSPAPNSFWQSRSKQQSRTPQNRSTTASPSPAQQSQTNQPPNKPAQQPGNFWTQRASQSREPSNGRPAPESAAPKSPTSTNSFNAAEVRAFLARDAQAGFTTYKVQEAQSSAKSGSGGGAAWGANKRES